MNEQLKEHITASDLTDEIKILLPDFFECDVNSDKNTMTLRFYNGQIFKLVIA